MNHFVLLYHMKRGLDQGDLLMNVTQFLRRAGIALLLFMLVVIVFAAALVFSPRARRLAMNAPFAIGIYNRIRPSLNIGNNTRCLNKLQQANVIFTLEPNRVEGSACILENVVNISTSAIRYNHSRRLTCRMALALSRFETEIVQLAAQRYFQQPVAEIRHLGTYNCRVMRGKQELLSEHAYANAIDIAAFRLADGATISVKQHWKDAGTKSQFLHEVAKKSCRVFNTVLTPNYNAMHADHFHFDQGFFGQCGY